MRDTVIGINAETINNDLSRREKRNRAMMVNLTS